MGHRSKDWLVSQVENVRELINDSQGLPFNELLNAQLIATILNELGVVFRKRVFDPWVTLWAFLSQVMKKDGSCEYAVMRVNAHRVSRGEKRCSEDTSSYCKARERLPEQVFSGATCQIGQQLHQKACPQWLWKDRSVHIVDGSTTTMADTPENQAEYPQPTNQKNGLGFPIARIVVILSLAVGTVLQAAIAPTKGKRTGETTLFRQLFHTFAAGDIVLGDRLFDSYRDMATLKARNVDMVFGRKQSRKKRYSHRDEYDRLVEWKRPKFDSSRFTREEWESLPESMQIRELGILVRRKGFRPKFVAVVTTLMDAELYPAKDIIQLFRMRWQIELDLRSIKRILGMYHCRCETPAMVRKEIWTYLLAYNLIRLRMAQAAAVHDLPPRSLSFKCAKDAIEVYTPVMAAAKSHAKVAETEQHMIDEIAMHRVGNRPSRVEPRAIKRRQNKYPILTSPRSIVQKRLAA
jgi:hypothetical protein